MSDESKTLIIITGPTAVGKTELSIELAKEFNTVVLSADSRQFYKEMSIGTAKPSEEELMAVPHYFVDFISINQPYDASRFEEDAIKILNQVFKTNDVAIMTGGSGMYLDAICYGFDEIPDTNPGLREELNNLYLKEGLEHLTTLLKEKDPVYYNRVDLQNPHRVIRGLEVCISSGKPFSTFRSGKLKKRNFDFLFIGLYRNRDELYERINERVDKMFNAGLLDEVKNLTPFKNFNALKTVGYKELFDYLEGKTDFKTAVQLIKQNTRRYAKRQLTWFKKNNKIHWFHPEDKEKIKYFIKSALNR